MIFKTIIGPAAEGEFYFPRPYLDDQLWKYIKSGCNVLISAPRRVGKTSFLKNICDQKKDNYIIKYHITESVNSTNEFFRRLYKSLLEELSTRNNIWEALHEILKRNKIEKIGTDGIELGGKDLNYFEEFIRLIKKIDLEDKLLFIIDEFSQTIENIINDQKENEAKIFFHQNRELRQNTSINKKIQFIYCGSIGLGNIADKLDEIKSINDLTELTIPPFSTKEALEMIGHITIDTSLIFNENVKNYMLNRIHWLMPYYIQIILDEIETVLVNEPGQHSINEKIIDLSIDNSLKKRNYFEHWHTRLRTALKGTEYTLAKEILNESSKSKQGISKTQIFDIAHKLTINDGYNVILRTLEYDGYIHLNEKNMYIFNSPLLKIWWGKNIAI